MEIRHGTLFVTLIFLGSGLLFGCDQSKSEPPSSQLLEDTLNTYSKNHGGVYTFTDVNKLDGQLQPDGLTYVMDYQAKIATHKCFHLPKTSRYQDGIDFTKNVDLKHDALKCASSRRVNGWSSMSGESSATFISGFQASFKTKALFTKKESGWQVSHIGITTNTFD